MIQMSLLAAASPALARAVAGSPALTLGASALVTLLDSELLQQRPGGTCCYPAPYVSLPGCSATAHLAPPQQQQQPSGQLWRAACVLGGGPPWWGGGRSRRCMATYAAGEHSKTTIPMYNWYTVIPFTNDLGDELMM